MAFNDFMKYECRYVKGLVAFLDILGFKEYIKKADADEVYSYYMQLQIFYQKSLDNGLNVAVFSDSIIITCEDVENSQFLSACSFLCNLIKWELKLYVRGGITYGEYFCEGNICYGRAVVDAYLCEEQAEDIKILIDPKAVLFMKKDIKYFDYDFCKKEYSINYYVYAWKVFFRMKRLALKNVMGGNSIKCVLEMDRSDLIRVLETNKGKRYYSKYKWLLVSFNRACDYARREGVHIFPILYEI